MTIRLAQNSTYEEQSDTRKENHNLMNDSNEYDDDSFISRTEQKKSMQIYVDMGTALLALNNKQLITIPLNSEVMDALQVAKKISSHNALKRQLSFIAKQIRKSDYESIQAGLDNLQQKDTLQDKVSKKTEQWRDRLLDEDSNALSEFIDQHQNSDRQKLAQLTRNAAKEKKQQQQEYEKNGTIKTPSKYKKQLFTALRVYISEKI